MAHPFPAQHHTGHPQYHTCVGLFQLMGPGLLAFTLLLVVIAVVVAAP